DKKQEYQDNTDRIEVERVFSLGKRCYGMSCITTKLLETQMTSIALSVFVTNLFRILRRILCTFLYQFQFLHDWN
ncbi:IS5/IS1182 family transposase, partial [Soehngenia saccharolytica]